MQGLAIRRIAQLGQIANPLRAEDALGYSQCEAVDRSGQSGQYAVWLLLSGRPGRPHGQLWMLGECG
jgi:hypothetical protein